MNSLNPPSMRRAAGALAVVAFLAACQHKQAGIDVPPVPQNIQRGDTLVLSSPLTLPPNAPLVFQREQIVPAAGVAWDVPYCALDAVGGAPRSLQPGPFSVGAVYYDERGSGGVGGTNAVTTVAMGAPGNPAARAYDLRCGWPAGSASTGLISIQQIFNAIGSAFTLSVPK
jgi:hypothetical protein